MIVQVPETSSARDFDFWMGSWNVRGRRLRERLAGCEDWETLEATSVAWPLLDGLGNVDEFRTEQGGGYSGMSLRLFDPATRTWSIYWADSRFPGPLEPPVVGAFSGDVGVFECDDSFAGQPIRVRYTWSRVSSGSPRWEQAFSPDGGETWETNWVNDFTRDDATLIARPLGRLSLRGSPGREESSMAVATPHAEPSAALVGDKGLKRDAIGYLSNLVIGVASTAPAYSLAATLGFIVAVPGMGLHAPAVLLVSFVPILLIAFGYKYLNRADPDCGTTFAWGTRAMGPYIGWINGWAIFVADVIVMASLSVIASTYTYLLFGWSAGANSTFWILVGSTVWIALMTWICWRGIELSARVQQFLLAAEIAVLAAFAIVAIVKVYANTPANSVRISADWFNPFALGFKPLVDGILLGIFIYWGWDSGVAVNEETESSAEAPGRAAVLSTLILLAIYLVVSAAAQSYGGTGLLVNNSNDVLRVLGTHVFGSPWDKLLIIAVLTSASASTQTTILPTARTTLSMARWKSIPGIFGHIHPKYLTPDVSTLGMGGLSIVFTVLLVGFNSSQDVLGDSITALGFAILFYYGFTGLACAVYFRKELVKSWKHFVAAGVVPLAGFGLMAAIFVKAFHDYSQTGAGYAKPLFGIQIPIVIGIGSLLLGVPLMLLCALKFREYFSRKPELAAEGSLDYVPEEVSLHF